RPSAALQHTIRRIAREALTNIVRHAQARSIELTLEASKQGWRIRIEDDGRGPPPSQIAGRGLGIMRRRAERLGGTVCFGRREQGGFFVEAVLPATDMTGHDPRSRATASAFEETNSFS